MEYIFTDQQIFYDGSQLRSGWLRETFGLSGEALGVFTGGCDVAWEHMLDSVDLALGHGIRARLMLHFISEHPGADLAVTVARQRLLAALAREILSDQFGLTDLRRDGDDLYRGERKLSISVAAPSPVSGLIHLALNIDPTGAPVPAVGLAELGIEPSPVGHALAAAFRAELLSCRQAAEKVRPAH